MNNRTLLLILLLLLAIYGLSRLFSGKRESSFRTELIQVDTTKVTTIAIDPKGKDNGEITLQREDAGWLVSNGTLTVPVTPGSVDGLLRNLALIRTQRIAAKSPDRWKEYEVTDTSGTRVRVYQDQKLLEDFIIGRFSFNPQAQSGVSFLRLTGEDEVYAVDGFEVLAFTHDFNSYRDRTVLRLKPEAIVREVDIQLPDTAYQLKRVDSQWLLNGTQALDSTTVADYINGLRQLSGDQFADDFDELRLDQLEQRSVALHGDGIGNPTTIYIYRDTTRSLPFVIRSSQQPKTFFASDSSGLFQRVFRPVETLRGTGQK